MRLRPALTTASLAIAISLLLLMPAHAEKRVALVIGNGAYQHTRALPNPRNDAEAIAKVLREIGFEVTVRHDQGYQDLRRVIREFGEAARGAGIALVHFAGHGLEVGGENYLVPVDARLARDSDLEYEAVTLTSLLGTVRGATRLRLVILDACRSNPLGEKMALAAGATRSVVRGLARIEPSGDVLVAYSAKAGTLAEDGAGPLSPYAGALVKHIATPGLDVRIMFGKVRDTVLSQTRTQEPFIYGSVGGDNIFLGGPASASGLRVEEDLAGLKTEVANLKAAVAAKQVAPRGDPPTDEVAQLKAKMALLEAEVKRREAALNTVGQPMAPPRSPQAETSHYHYVWDTRPPDDWLALRTEPSLNSGRRIKKMPNGTLLDVIQTGPDGWLYVRVVGTGEEGWSLSGLGSRKWIYCCRSK